MTTKKTPAKTTDHTTAKPTTRTANKTTTKTATKSATKPADKDAATAAASAPAAAKPASKAPVKTTAPAGSNVSRYAMIAVLAVAAFFGAYRFASASSQQGVSGGIASAASGLIPAASGGAAAGGGCCGGGGAPVEGKATVAGGVQKIAVDLSSGSYNPNVLKLKAGVPTEITFGQSSGCTAQVQSSDLGFSEDLTSGPKTVKVGALKPGTYNFACGMNMVTGQIVVE